MFEDLSIPSMGAGSDLMLFLNCSDCGLLGPPPSAILTLPPPPLPSFLQRTPLDELLQMGVTDNRTAGEVAAEAAASGANMVHDNSGPCGPMCEWNTNKPGVEFIELPRQVGTVVDDTWFLVLISCCAGVLLLGGILAIIMLRCRSNSGGKTGLGIDPTALAHHKPSKAAGGCEVLYPTVTAPAPGDPRALWAALTPSGATHHFVSPAPAPVPTATHFQLTQRHLSGSAAPPQPPAEPEYAMPMCAGPPPSEPPPPPPVMVAAFSPSAHAMKIATKTSRSSASTLPQRTRTDSTASFDNSGFIDSDDAAYEMAREDLMSMSPYTTATMSTRNMAMASGGRTWRPRVSSPTRIENPNMPPLNMHPAAAYIGTGRRSVRRSPRRGSDSAAAPPAL